MISKNPFPGEKSSTVTSTHGHLDKTSTLLVEKKREQLLKSNTDMLTIDSLYNMEHPRSAAKLEPRDPKSPIPKKRKKVPANTVTKVPSHLRIP